MVKMTGIYTTEKHCTATHEPSGSIIETDAPKDNQGRGEKFSPTDLMGVALGTCILTTLAIVAEKDNVSVKGSKFSVTKVMASNPRRIESLKIAIDVPNSIPESYREKIEVTANNCPVKKSLHPDLVATIEISYSL